MSVSLALETAHPSEQTFPNKCNIHRPQSSRHDHVACEINCTPDILAVVIMVSKSDLNWKLHPLEQIFPNKILTVNIHHSLADMIMWSVRLIAL